MFSPIILFASAALVLYYLLIMRPPRRKAYIAGLTLPKYIEFRWLPHVALRN